VVLDSYCKQVGCGRGSEQEQWLRKDLAAHPVACTLAYFHHPLFSSGYHGDGKEVKDLWQALYDANADVVVNGHDHDYERFAPQDPEGRADPAHGIREFVAGTGGAPQRWTLHHRPNSEARNSSTHGVLKLTLHNGGYDWQFIPVAGKTFTDSGSDKCH
jgi:3',5'-cyclic AMP phosphodiesterase CpdA